MTPADTFKLTYATMFNPPEEFHTKFERSLAKIRGDLGREHAMIIDGKEVLAEKKYADHNPANAAEVLAVFQKGDAAHAAQALSAARKAFPAWSRTKWQERIALLRKAADLITERTFDMGAVVALEVGKNRTESLGDVAESADLIRYACDRMEAADGFVNEMGRDPLAGFHARNVSVLRPYGVWVVISPFNFPASLTAGPTGAALATGNTVVIKPSSDATWTTRLIAECLRDAGIPDGVCNFISGPGSTLGQALIDAPEVDGLTFTGSFEVGMGIHRAFVNRSWIRPLILEMGGKNPAIVSRNAELEDAAIGIVRSAFGLQGQKCSACSRVFIEETVFDALVERIVALTNNLAIGDPCMRENWLGPVINQNAYRDYQRFCRELGQAGRILTGAKVLSEGAHAQGYFCAPTVVLDLPDDHYLWKHEMFVPITTIASVKSLEEAMERANNVSYGLTAGFYGTDEEVDWFFDQIQAGVAYANRPQGATTGAWPGFQPFGGWKGSGSTGKNSGGLHYLQLYLHEQIRSMVRRA